MGRVEKGKIVNHSGVARVRLNEQELYALINALDKVLEEYRTREATSDYYKKLHRLRRKLKKNRKRLCLSKVVEKA